MHSSFVSSPSASLSYLRKTSLMTSSDNVTLKRFVTITRAAAVRSRCLLLRFNAILEDSSKREDCAASASVAWPAAGNSDGGCCGSWRNHTHKNRVSKAVQGFRSTPPGNHVIISR